MRYLVAAVFVVLASPSLAADFSSPLRDFDGKPICMSVSREPAETCPEDQLATLGKIIRAALIAPMPPEQGANPETVLNNKLRLGDLAQAIGAGGEIKLKSEDIVVIKKAVSAAYSSPLIVWSVVRELEGR